MPTYLNVIDRDIKFTRRLSYSTSSVNGYPLYNLRVEITMYGDNYIYSYIHNLSMAYILLLFI